MNNIKHDIKEEILDDINMMQKRLNYAQDYVNNSMPANAYHELELIKYLIYPTMDMLNIIMTNDKD